MKYETAVLRNNLKESASVEYAIALQDAFILKEIMRKYGIGGDE